MPRVSVLQIFTFLLLISACVYVANHVARYLLREDGGYSEWSGFTECSRTCGGGIRLRRRVCSHPHPRLGGRNCSSLGKPIQMFRCNRNPCPVNGGYGNWLPFEACSSTCGEGTHKRRRNCDSPLPQYGGKNCKEMELGEDTETKKCNERKCPVNGGYSEWSKFSDCSVTCGGGIKLRNRKCTNPMPDPDGKNCTELGPSEETLTCNTQACPTTLPPTTLPPTTLPPTTLPPTTELPPTTTKSNKITTESQKPIEKQENSTVIPSKSTEVRSKSIEEEPKSSETQPKITEEPPKYNGKIQPVESTEMQTKSTEALPSFDEKQNNTAALIPSELGNVTESFQS